MELTPLKVGGTGSRSADPEQPPERPDRYESGTANVVGIAGLGAAVSWLASHFDSIRKRRPYLTRLLYQGIRKVGNAVLLSPEDSDGIVTFVLKNADPSEVADTLWNRYQIAVRGGMHCAPLAHRYLGTEQSGAVRMSLGAFSTEGDVLQAVEAVGRIAKKVT